MDQNKIHMITCCHVDPIQICVEIWPLSLEMKCEVTNMENRNDLCIISCVAHC